MANEVSAGDVQRVIDGFNDYIKNAVRNKRFNVGDMKNFMEPIFNDAGYRNENGGAVHNILILHETSAGDFVTMSAAIRELRRVYPDARITLVINKSAENLAYLCPYADDVIVKSFVLNNGKTSAGASNDFNNSIKRCRLFTTMVRDLLRRRYDLAIAFVYDKRPSTALLAYMSGAARRISHHTGFWKALLTDIVPQQSRKTHAADKALSYVEFLKGHFVIDRELEVWFSQITLDTVKSIIPQSKKIYAIGLGGDENRENYPPEYYAELINLIAQHDDDARFILIGEPADAGAPSIIMHNTEHGRVINLSGRLSDTQKAATLSLCNAYIGNFSCNVHLAAASGVPALVVSGLPLQFGQADPYIRRWYPYNVPSVIVCAINSELSDQCAAPRDLFIAFKVLLEQIHYGIVDYTLFDGERIIQRPKQIVPEIDIQRVVDGFNEFISRAVETKNFDANEMKKFMEPIFTDAGYRNENVDGAVNNVLILQEAAAGDFITMSSTIREIRRLYPNAHITLVVNTRAGSFAEYCPHVDEIIVKRFILDNGRTSTGATDDDFSNLISKCRLNLSVAEELLQRRYDVAFAPIYGIYPTTPLLAYMSGAARRISHHIAVWKPLLTDVVPQQKYDAHITDRTLSYVEYLTGEPVTDRDLEAWFSQRDLEKMTSLMPVSKKIYAIGLGGGNTSRGHYPPQSYAALMNMIIENDDDVNFILLGGPKELNEAEIVTANVDPGRVVNLVGKITFSQTAAAISLSNIYIGNDTATVHLSAATKTPVLVPYCFPLEFEQTFFNRRAPAFRMWSPYHVTSVIVLPTHALPGCKHPKDYRGCSVNEPHCITQITPQTMFDAYKLLLEQIDKGTGDYVIYNADLGVVGDRTEVAADAVHNVVDAFKDFARCASKVKKFNVADLKEFMEPIFVDAGYRSNNDTVSHILIVHEGTAADFMMMTALIKEIRRLYPTAFITLVVDDTAVNIATYCPHVNEVVSKNFSFDGKRSNAAPNDVENLTKRCSLHLGVAENLLQHRYDLAIACVYGKNPSTPLLAYMSGAKRRISHHNGLWAPLLTDVIDPKNLGFNFAEKAISYIEYLIGETVTNRNLEPWFDPNDLDKVKPLMPQSKKIYALGLDGLATDYYPPELYATVINLILSEDNGVNFVLLGNENDVAKSDVVMNLAVAGRVVNLTGKLNFAGTSAAGSLCDLYIGNENAGTYQAAASRKPVLVIGRDVLDVDKIFDHIRHWYSYEIPSVIVNPIHKPDVNPNEAAPSAPIAPTDLMNGYRVLLERISKGLTRTVLLDAK